MVYLLKFEMDGLTEEEQYQVCKRVELIRDKVYPDLDIDITVLHRENRVLIKQSVPDDLALELFRLLSSVSVDKAYDDYYNTGVDSRLTCSLCFEDEFPL